MLISLHKQATTTPKIRAAIPTGRGGCEVVTPTTGAVAAGIQAIRA